MSKLFQISEEQPNYNKLVFFDTETVSLRPPYIISIAYIAYENNKLSKAEYLVCNPDYPIDPGASQVNGFYNDDLLDNKLWPEVWDNIKEHFENAILLGHNVNFDETALFQSNSRYNIPMPKKYWTCCTMKNARLLLPKPTVINHKLGTLCEYFSINLDNWHNASADTLACLKVYNKLIELSDGNLKIEKGKYCSEENTDKDDFDF